MCMNAMYGMAYMYDLVVFLLRHNQYEQIEMARIGWTNWSWAEWVSECVFVHVYISKWKICIKQHYGYNVSHFTFLVEMVHSTSLQCTYVNWENWQKYVIIIEWVLWLRPRSRSHTELLFSVGQTVNKDKQSNKIAEKYIHHDLDDESKWIMRMYRNEIIKILNSIQCWRARAYSLCTAYNLCFYLNFISSYYRLFRYDKHLWHSNNANHLAKT